MLRTIDDRPAWRRDEALTVEQAIVASTVTPAWLAGDERRRGRLLPGFLADLVVLSRDPFTCPPDELESVEVVVDDGRRPLGAQAAALGLSLIEAVDRPAADGMIRVVATRTMLQVHQTETCSVAACAEIVGAKWTVLIVHDLSEGPAPVHRDRALAAPGSARARWPSGCAGSRPRRSSIRRSYAESPPRVEYELTEKGAALLPLIAEMRHFGHDWLGCGVHEH